MRSVVRILIFTYLLFQFSSALSQQIKFEKVLDGSLTGTKYVRGIVKDKQGYIWISTAAGLYRYDGLTFKSFYYQTGNKDSSSKNYISCLAVDTTGIIWLGTFNGIEKFDQATGVFTSIQHDAANPSSLINDSVSCMMRDHLNNLWIGTFGGLDKLNLITRNFTHYSAEKNNPVGLSSNQVNTLFEDSQGMIWIGCGFVGFNYPSESPEGGLNRFDPSTGKFIHYFHNPADTNSLISNKVTAIFEDSKANFWIGTNLNGLHTLDRKTGKFTRYLYDSSSPEKLSLPRPVTGYPSIWNAVSLINEDNNGAIWMSTFLQGINRYDLASKKMNHYGDILMRTNPEYYKEDTISGFKEPTNNGAFSFLNTRDGAFWMGTVDGNLYKIADPHASIPYFNLDAGANSFYQENDSILWIGTSIKGLDRRNIKTGENTWLTNKNGEFNIPPNHDILGLRGDANSNLWIGTFTGLYQLNLKNNIFSRHPHDLRNDNSPAGDSIQCLFVDKQDLWIGNLHRGLDKMNISDGTFSHFTRNKDSTSIINNSINCITEDNNADVWVGTVAGLDRLDQKTNKFSHFLKESEVLSICTDASGMVWAGTTEGFYYFDIQKNEFTEYNNQNSPVKIRNVLHIIEDNEHNLWLTTNNAILKIDRQTNAVNVYGKNYGVHYNNYYDCDNYKLKNGQLLIGDQNGYYVISPQTFHLDKSISLNLTSFKIGNEEIKPMQGTVLNASISQAKEIRLSYKQNAFSFDFSVIDYSDAGEAKYFFMLENYDNAWRDIGTDHKAYFFNVPPGHYIFRVKAINPDGARAEKSILVIISPPWWRTWWAYMIFALLIIGAIWAFIYYRSLALRKENRLLEEKVNHRTEQLKRSLEDLRSAQAQLIQSEKMASLGELTAGIAHEIQNPLNFVNNFSDVNQELLIEMKDEMDKGNINDARSIANDIKANEEKINHHGKRADAIVKGMLQHSRSSSNVKESTDINKLADEYIRLAYHGLRAKEKEFNATMNIDLDESIGKINIIPQDIGRVLLNLYNNAFYAVGEKSKQQIDGYEPTVSISTKKINDKVVLTVMDNGNGIPQKVVDKIFQPFFTTKPTGQGTGLGLSLSYDIVKAHGGEIKVNTKENEGSEFLIQLPMST